MVWILIIGLIIAVINVILTYTELMPFFKGLKQLNEYTNYGTFQDKFMYPFRFICLIPLLTPLLLDVTVAAICAAIGFSGGVYGAIIGISLGFTASLMVKFHRHFISPRIKSDRSTWKLQQNH